MVSPLVCATLSVSTTFSNILRYLYEKSLHNNRKCERVHCAGWCKGDDVQNSRSISNYYIAPPFFQNGTKSGFEMCFCPSTLGARAKARLESRIKKFTPHCVCRPGHVSRTNACTYRKQARSRGAVKEVITRYKTRSKYTPRIYSQNIRPKYYALIIKNGTK